MPPYEESHLGGFAPTPDPTKARAADARNRALRTFLQGLGYAVLAAIVMVLLPVFTDAHGWGDFQWKVLSFALVQAVGMTVLSYVMRKVLDPSGVPTPLPPADPGPPEAGVVDTLLLLVLATFVLVVLLFFGVHLHLR